MVEKMLDERDDYDYTILIARTFLKDVERPAPSDIEKFVDMAILVLRGKGRLCEFDRTKLVEELSSQLNVFVVGDATMLKEAEEHKEWLHERKHEIAWDFWRRFEEYQLTKKHLALDPLRKVDVHTDLILQQLEDPQRPGAWSRRGLVVGQVQSGKTLNYTALINKAADAGYKVVIVLAGMWEDLRTQTQLRLAEGFLGREINRAFEVNGDAKIGVGLIRSTPRAICGTSIAGDFGKTVAKQLSAVVGGHEPILLVVKKNKTVLENVMRWIKGSSDHHSTPSGEVLIKDVPLLLIDDEADHASINTKEVPEDDEGNVDPEHDPTVINGLIRKLLSRFEKNAYIGYTATPFANIFIRHDAVATGYGDDLFPRSFIINLPAPNDYVGPAEVFRYGEYGTIGGTSPYIRAVDDYQSWLPEDHKKDRVPGPTPPSLKEAVLGFILTCALRIVRGQEHEHNSMLVHVTRFTDVQKKVAERLKIELAELVHRLRYGDGASSEKIHDTMRQLWEERYKQTSETLGANAIVWEQIEPVLYKAASKIQVKTINGTAKDVLQYERGTTYVIAVGGNKLSRGLTLSGLSVSYYLRVTRMYDTLMQMGRWFGYRHGYQDLCRLYTTKTLVEWYQHIGEADAELRAEFDVMAELDNTPKEYGLKVRSHPAGMVITAMNKMQDGTPMKVSYSGCLNQTIDFHRSSQIVRENFERTERFLCECENASKAAMNPQGRIIWSDVPGEIVAKFIEQQELYPVGSRVRPQYIADYIRKLVNRGELIKWTVCVIGSGEGGTYTINNRTINLSIREPKDLYTDERRYTIGTLISPEDEAVDLGGKRDDLVPEKGKDRGKKLRTLRDRTRGLLLIYPIDQKGRGDNKPIIGFATSFPASETDEGVDYVVNKVFIESARG